MSPQAMSGARPQPCPNRTCSDSEFWGLRSNVDVREAVVRFGLVAAALVVSVHTVEAALTSIYRKLDVRSRTELARIHPAPGKE